MTRLDDSDFSRGADDTSNVNGDDGKPAKNRVDDAAEDAVSSKVCQSEQKHAPPEHPFIQTRREKKSYSKIILFSSSKWCKLFISVLMAAAPSLTLLCMPSFDAFYCTPGGWCSWVLWYPHSWLLAMFYIQFLFASLRNPGRAKDIDVKASYKVISQNPDLNMWYTPRWCTSCECWKPPRTHHCGICDRCTLRMDHHCPWMGNCLGLHNVGHFLLMYAYAMAALAVNIVLCVGMMLPYCLTWIFELHTIFWTLEWIQLISPIRLVLLWWRDVMGTFIYTVMAAHGWHIASLSVVSVLSFMLVIGMAVPYSMTVASNSTVLENQLKNRSEYIILTDDVVVPIGVSFYRQNMRNNIGEVFGTQWFRALLPFPLRVNSRVGTHPMASTSASALLLRRLETVRIEGCQETVGSLEELGIVSGPAPVTQS